MFFQNNTEMKTIKYPLILLMLASFNSCMVRHNAYAVAIQKNNYYAKYGEVSRYSLIHTRPPIN